MNPARRRWLAGLTTLCASAGRSAHSVQAAQAAQDSVIQAGRRLEFPRDHGAHTAARTEWWYATGWLGTEAAPSFGFQLTFFRSRTGLAADNPSRFAPRHLLFAHAAITDLKTRAQAPAHHHAQRVARWSGDTQTVHVGASSDGGDVRLAGWQLRDTGTHWQATLPTDTFTLEVQLQRQQPLLLQGDAGYSRKGPDAGQASHYYSEPQLAAAAQITLKGRQHSAQGRAWLDHEWSDQILHREAVGWDWIGMNLFDGSALTAFVLRRADGSGLWAGGSFRQRDGLAKSSGNARSFSASEVQWTAGRRWRSAASNTDYPVQWFVNTPAGRFEVRALLDAQELDSRGSTGSIYWEGLSELLDMQGQRVGLGYLEMTGYQAPLRMG